MGSVSDGVSAPAPGVLPRYANELAVTKPIKRRTVLALANSKSFLIVLPPFV
jgi:hypothetical protein